MCLNCGCGEYWDKRGKATNLTMEEVEQAAKGEGAGVGGGTVVGEGLEPHAMDKRASSNGNRMTTFFIDSSVIDL